MFSVRLGAVNKVFVYKINNIAVMAEPSVDGWSWFPALALGVSLLKCLFINA